VTVDTGALQGTTEAGIGVFRGIPYAAPPVGELRWRPPQPAAKWEGVRKADAFGPACPQIPDSPTYLGGPIGKTGEDCLYLNIWAPGGAGPTKLPVMVWIHGGGFFSGAGSERVYDGTEFARRGVVLVTLNYRLGRLGFFAHPALSGAASGELRGNYGFMDVIAALQWVRRNVAAFGGDPGNVTIFGESAGGMTAQALMASPLATGLFHKAIVESGAFYQPMHGLADAESLGAAFGKRFGIEGDSAAAAAALRALPVDRIVPTAPSMDEIRAIMAGGPMADGKLLPRGYFEAFARGEQARIPLIIGSNSLESVVWMFGTGQAVGTVPILPASPDALLAGFGADKDKILDAYRARFETDAAGLGAALASDLIVGAGTRYQASRQAGSGAPTYLYRFSATPAPLKGVVAGAPHGTELFYVFGALDKIRSGKGQPSEQDRKLSAAMLDYWTAFARTGNPDHDGLPHWPRYEDGTKLSLDFTDGGPVPGHPEGNAADLLETHIRAEIAKR